MAMGARARDLKGRGKRNKGLALQRAADDLDQGIGQVRQVAQGLVLDLAVLAVAAAQQAGAIDLVLVVTMSNIFSDYISRSKKSSEEEDLSTTTTTCRHSSDYEAPGTSA
jgi:hypothetical protein